MHKYFINANQIKFKNYDEKYNYIFHIYISIRHNDIFRLNIHVFFLSFLKNVHVYSTRILENIHVYLMILI
jgi:Iap family predicted aminopeptidase